MHILQLDDTVCTPLHTLTHHQPITCVRYSDNGRYLVAADSGRRIVPYDVQVCARTYRRTHTRTGQLLGGVVEGMDVSYGESCVRRLVA